MNLVKIVQAESIENLEIEINKLATQAKIINATMCLPSDTLRCFATVVIDSFEVAQNNVMPKTKEPIRIYPSDIKFNRNHSFNSLEVSYSINGRTYKASGSDLEGEQIVLQKLIQEISEDYIVLEFIK